ncbi:MAG TPA: hypothetical protein VFM97_09540 [Gammaproteobacteria bacterium]|nr:hypothetical protein [Gammaproteobacteria bacterium]
MIEGRTIELGGEERIIPPLNLKALRTLKPEIDRLSTGNIAANGLGDEDIDAIVKIVHAAIARNYPDITAEQVEDWIDLGNSAEVIGAVMTQSGLTRQQGPAGERPGNPPSRSTGTNSIGSSSVRPAGAGNTSTST